MNKTSSKIQSLIVRHLLKHGSIEIKLPDGVILQIGITQEAVNGTKKVKDNYCWVATSKDKRSIVMDSEYFMNLQFQDDLIVVDDKFLEDGEVIRRLEVV